MKEEQDFLRTLTLLMRRTRESKIEWKEVTPSLAPSRVLPAYEAEFRGTHFRVADVRGYALVPDIAKLMANASAPGSEETYQLIITDLANESRIESPPLKAVTDLVAVIQIQQEEQEREQREVRRGHLEEINRRLEAAE